MTLKGQTYDDKPEIFGEFDRLAESFRQANVKYNMIVLLDEPNTSRPDVQGETEGEDSAEKAETSGGSSRRW